MNYLHAILLILGGFLAIEGLLFSKVPDAKRLIDKLVAAEAFIGIGLLVIGLFRLIDWGPINTVRAAGHGLPGLTIFAAVWSAILLGFLFGMPQIAKWIPGESGAENKAVQLSNKLAPVETVLGFVATVAGTLMLLYQLGVLKAL